MDPNSSLRKICLGDDVIEISSDKVEGSGDWSSLEYQDTTVSKGKKVMSALCFYRMETYEISEWYIAPCFMNGVEAFDGEVNLAFDENLISNEFVVKLCLDYERKASFICVQDGEKQLYKKRAMENLNLFYQDVGPSSGAGVHLTQEEAAKEALAIRISQRCVLLKEERPVFKTMAYNDKYRKILDEI
uniref:Uncharacterized protein n=1 Tax=Tanacetum cinerariifolium TaxID=118510 RepID=A0A699KRU2_TANCI|nr:hypothetical protein [Tanacetum cinerariifolium]